MASAAGLSGFSTTLSGSQSSSILDIRNIGGPDNEVDDIDITTMSSSNGWKEFISGLKDAGELTVTVTYGESEYSNLHTHLGTSQSWTITFPDSSTFVCNGYIKGLSSEIPYDDIIECTVTLKLSGSPTFTVA